MTESKDPGKVYKLIELSESQIFQDLFVINELDFKEDGFVEIGAADGKYLSNTWDLKLKKFKWDGLVVEPAKNLVRRY